MELPLERHNRSAVTPSAQTRFSAELQLLQPVAPCPLSDVATRLSKVAKFAARAIENQQNCILSFPSDHAHGLP
jgi:hypothetical protein